MAKGRTNPEVDAYVAGFTEAVRGHLGGIRARVHALVPEVEETMSYRMPTFRVGGQVLCYLGGFTAHVSIFPVPPGDPAQAATLAAYTHGKGTLRFSATVPLPVDVVDLALRLHLERLDRPISDR